MSDKLPERVWIEEELFRHGNSGVMARAEQKYPEEVPYILESSVAGLVEALEPFAGIESADGDDFSGVHEDVILRVEVTAREIHRARDALSSYRAKRGE